MTQDDAQHPGHGAEPGGAKIGLDTGEVIGEHYVLERMLGEGGFGQVWLARDRRTGMRVAVKIVPGSYAMDSGWYEAQVMRRIKQDGVAQLLDEGRDLARQLSFLVMNVVDGEPFPGRPAGALREDTRSPAGEEVRREPVSWRVLAQNWRGRVPTGSCASSSEKQRSPNSVS